MRAPGGPGNTGRTLVLASSSPYRRALLERFGLPFVCRSPDIDESRLPGEPPQTLVRRLGEAKAAAVAAFAPDALVIAGDQVAVLGEEIFGKPLTAARAEQQLRAASGREMTFLTSLAVLDTASGAVASEIVTVSVVFRTLSDVEISTYVAIERPLDCAGSFKCEGLGITLFDRIESGDPTALTGLPLITLNRLLAQQGFDVLGVLSAQREDVRE